MSMNTTMITTTSTGPKGAEWEQRGRCICETLSGEPCTPRTPADHANLVLPHFACCLALYPR